MWLYGQSVQHLSQNQASIRSNTAFPASHRFDEVLKRVWDTLHSGCGTVTTALLTFCAGLDVASFDEPLHGLLMRLGLQKDYTG